MTHPCATSITIEDGVRREIPARVITSDTIVSESHNGATCVHAGTLTLGWRSSTNGSLTVLAGGRATIQGSHNGSLNVEDGASVEVDGSQNGSVHVNAGGLVTVTARGTLSGSLHISGRIENAGTRGGSVDKSSNGTLVDLPGSTVVQPERTAGGASIYRFELAK